MEDFNKSIDSIKEKIGEENSALISDELVGILSEHKAMQDKTEEYAKQIDSLKQEKENLVTANSKLFQRLGFEDNAKQSFQTAQHEEAKVDTEIKLSSIINDKGDII